MKLGRDGAVQARREGEQPLVRRRSHWSGALFSFLFLTALTGALAVLLLPEETLARWTSRAKIGSEQAKTTKFETQPVPKVTAPEHPSRSLDIRLTNLEQLGEQVSVFDPVLRSRAIAKLNKAARLDREANLVRATNVMEDRLAQVNANIASLDSIEASSDEDRARQRAARSAYEVQADFIMAAFEDQTQSIQTAVERERTRILRILQGL